MFLAGRVIVISDFIDYGMSYTSYPSKITTSVSGRLATVGDRSGTTVECLINGDDLSLNNLNLSKGSEFIFFGGTRIKTRGIFFLLIKILKFRKSGLLDYC